jgi:hypothetical protein
MKSKLRAGNVVLTIFETNIKKYSLETSTKVNDEWLNGTVFTISDLQNARDIIDKVLQDRVRMVR